MKLKTKAWLVSQGLLVLTAVLIQLTFYREIKLGPLLGMTKRPYWEIIMDRPPAIPDFVREKQLPPRLWDARLPLSPDEIRAAKLAGAPKSPPQRGWFADGLLRCPFGEWSLFYNFSCFMLVYSKANHAQATPRRKSLGLIINKCLFN